MELLRQTVMMAHPTWFIQLLILSVIAVQYASSEDSSVCKSDGTDIACIEAAAPLQVERGIVPIAPSFQPCADLYQKQLAAAQVLMNHAKVLNNTGDLARSKLLAKDAYLLDATGAVADNFKGQSSCSRLPLPNQVLRANNIKQIVPANLFRLSIQYNAPLLFLAIPGSPQSAPYRDELLRDAAEFVDRIIFVIAEGDELYKFATTKHLHSLSGKVISYYLSHALRHINPSTSFHLEPVNLNEDGLKSFMRQMLLEETFAHGRSRHGQPDARRPGVGKSASLDPDFLNSEVVVEPGGTIMRLPTRGIPELVNLEVAPADGNTSEQFVQVPRESNLSAVDFVHRYVARGHPVVVTDAMQNWTALGKWNLPWVFQKYKKKVAKLDPKEGGMWLVEIPQVSKRLREDYGVPYFLDLGTPENSPLNQSAASGLSSEMLYFSPSNRVATVRHIDTNCAQSWSAQLEGRKQWLLWPPPGANPELKPMATILEPGDMIVFYTGWHHEARNVYDNRSLSLSSFWKHPVPSNFLWENRDWILEQKQYTMCGVIWKLQTGRPFKNSIEDDFLH